MGEVPYSGHALRIQDYRSGPRTPAPLIGEHSFEVMQDLLGMDVEEIAAIIATGVVA